MLQPQRTKLLGDLYYGDDTPEYVAPPIKEMKELGAAKEQDYLLTRDKTNEIDKITRTLPYTPQSSGVYNEWKDKVSSAIGSINADNYEDNVLNVTQIANDMQNKWGGNELVKQASQLQDELAVVDKAYEEGIIVDPEKAAWKKQEIAKGTGSVYADEDGYYKNPGVGKATIVPYIDIPKELDSILKGWESDKMYERTSDGKFRVNPLTPGYLSTLNKEFVTEAELQSAALAYVNSNPKMQAYLDDETAFQMRNSNPTVESIFAIAKPEHLEAIFGKKNISAEEAQLQVSSGKVDIKKQLSAMVKNGVIGQSIALPVAKYSFDKENMDTMLDVMLMEELKFNAAAAKTKAGEQALDNSIVSIEPFQAVQELRPDDIVAIKQQKEDLKGRRNTLQAKINTTSRALAKGTPGVTADQIVDQNAELTRLDEDIQEIHEQEMQVTSTFEKEGKQAGINLDDEYKVILPKARETAVNKNREILQSKNTSMNITKSVINKGGKDYFVFKGRNGAKDRTIPVEEVLANKASGISKGTGADASKYIYRTSEDKSNFSKSNNVIDDTFFDDRGMPVQDTLLNYTANNDRTLGDPYVDDFYKTPNSQEYKNIMSEAYNTKERATMFNADEAYTSNKFILPRTALKPLDKIQKERGMFNSPISSNLSSIVVTGETNKTALKQLQVLEDADNESFRNNPSQYSVKVGDKLENLGTYLKTKYGIPSLSKEFIDWDKSSTKMVLATDRAAGQKYGISISLTKEGLEKVADNSNDTFTKEPTIKLVGVNSIKNVPTEQAKIKNILSNAYGEIAEDNTEYGLSVRQQMGRLMADQMPAIGGEIDRLNLYTVPPGVKKPINLMGTKYEISTTDKDLDSTDILDTDFHLGMDNGGQKIIFAQNSKGESDWFDEGEVEASNQRIIDATAKLKNALPNKKAQAQSELDTAMSLRMSKVSFNSPNDLKAFIGSRVLANEYQAKRRAEAEVNANNPYTQFRMSTTTRTSGAGSYTVKSNTVTSNDYNQFNTVVKAMYGIQGDKQIQLKNNSTGALQTISARVPQSALVDISSYLPKGTVSTDNNFPYVSKDVSNNVVTTMKTHGLTYTGGFRGEGTHEGLPESGDNSLHKYGYAVDARADKNGLAFYDKMVNDPDGLARLGIAKLIKHDVKGTVHIHIEYAPNKM